MRRLRALLPPPRAAAALSAASLIALAFAPAQYLGRQEDDLLYYLAAKALWTGRYALMTAVGRPALTGTAPGWPLLLAPAALAGAPALAQAWAALFAAAVPWLSWAWLRRRLKPLPALLAALLAGTSPLLLAQAGTLMPEAAYACVFFAALLALEDGRTARAGGWGALLLLVRPAGVSALPALGADALRRRRPRELAAALAPALAAGAAWSAWSWLRSGGVQEAGELALAYGGAGRASPLRVAADNARFYAASLGGGFLPPRLADGPLAAALGAALLALAAAGAAKALRRRWSDPAALALLGAAGMHLAWTWHYERYWIPLLPLALWAAAETLGAAAAPALGVLLAAQLGAQVLPRLGRPSPWAEPELARTYAWLAARPEPGALASALPTRDGWWSGRPSTPLPVAADAAALAAELGRRRVRWALRQDGLDVGLSDAPAAPLARELARAYAQLDDRRFFRVAHAEPAESARVYEAVR